MTNNIYKRLCLLSFLVLSACTKSEPDITGSWVVNDEFFKATYHLQLEEGSLAALVLDYDDGTTRIKYDAENERYLFRGLEWDKDSFVDGMSGATKKGDTWSFRLTRMVKDTLMVEQHISGKVLKEVWVRSKDKYEVF